MKAIHNLQVWQIQLRYTVFNTSKIQNESNSQRKRGATVATVYCVQYVKDTK